MHDPDVLEVVGMADPEAQLYVVVVVTELGTAT